MAILRKGFKYLALFLFIGIITTLGALAAASYFAIDQLRKLPESPNHNLQAVIKIGQNYLQEFETFESLHASLQNKKMPPLCSTICNPVSIDQNELIENRTAYLASYYKTMGPKAFQDPLFRFKIEQLSLVSKTLPPPLRGVAGDLLNEEDLKQASQWKLALRLEGSLLAALPSLPERFQTYSVENNRLTLLRAWIKACHLGANPKKIMTECRAEYP